MANPHKGEIAFEANGKTYTLSFSANAMVELDTAINRDIDDLIRSLAAGERVPLATVRVAFWCALLDHHPDMTLDDTKAVLRHIKPADMGRLLGEAFLRSMPEVKDGDAQNPPQPDQGGTGPASSTPGVKAA